MLPYDFAVPLGLQVVGIHKAYRRFQTQVYLRAFSSFQPLRLPEYWRSGCFAWPKRSKQAIIMGAGVPQTLYRVDNAPIQRHCKELTIICAVELTQLYQIAKANDFRQHPNRAVHIDDFYRASICPAIHHIA